MPCFNSCRIQETSGFILSGVHGFPILELNALYLSNFVIRISCKCLFVYIICTTI
jgi:hypothetical protein